jgi:hypothetical protein
MRVKMVLLSCESGRERRLALDWGSIFVEMKIKCYLFFA